MHLARPGHRIYFSLGEFPIALIVFFWRGILDIYLGVFLKSIPPVSLSVYV